MPGDLRLAALALLLHAQTVWQAVVMCCPAAVVVVVVVVVAVVAALAAAVAVAVGGMLGLWQHEVCRWVWEEQEAADHAEAAALLHRFAPRW